MKSEEFAEAVGSVAGEFEGARLGDGRLPKRLQRIARVVSVSPAKGFPQAAGSDAELEGIYRFLNNRRVTYGALVDAHAVQTCERVVAAGTALVVHDTTEMKFSGKAHREGLGFLQGASQGFLAHCALAVAADGSKQPLGTLGLACWARLQRGRSRTSSGRKRAGSDYAGTPHKESDRWGEMVRTVRDRVGGRASLIHVMDREADAYPLLASMIEHEDRFVVRVARDRVILTEEGDRSLLSEAAGLAETVVEVDVPISHRPSSTMPRRERSFAARDQRIARLSFSCQSVEIRRPNYLRLAPETLHVNLVHVIERDPPGDEEPVSWTLVTTEPIGSTKEMIAIVQHYKTRWTIEELFKALKTGCALQQRQLESYDALANTLALFLPVAWQMLLLRYLSRTAPDGPATDVLTPTQLQVLKAFPRRRLPDRLTAQDALHAVAALGGHLKHNGPPGWITIGRGMAELLTLERGWMAALDATQQKQTKRSDQS
jgi:Transposase DNA-binding/Transposase DDE domain